MPTRVPRCTIQPRDPQAHSRPAAPSRRPGPPCAFRARDRPYYAGDSFAERLPSQPGEGRCIPTPALRKTTHQVVSELGKGCGRAEAPTRRELSRTSQPRSAGFCFLHSDWRFEHPISRSGILSLNLSFSAEHQQIARPRSVGIVFLCYDLLFGG